MTISVIVAVSDNGVIGKDGKIPWKLSTDLARFEEITGGHACIMGRKTFESFGEPLKGRKNIVISNRGYSKTYKSTRGNDDLYAFDCIKDVLTCGYERDFFIIGGQQIYDEIFKTPELIHRVYLTRVHCNVEGDAFFQHNFPYPDQVPLGRGFLWPNKEDFVWHLISEEPIPKSDKDEYDSTFQVWENRG